MYNGTFLPRPTPDLNKYILSLLQKSHHWIQLKQIQAFLITLGHGQTQFYSFKLVRFCALVLANLNYARLIFDAQQSPNVYLYTSLITAYAANSDSQSSILLYKQMVSRGQARPNHFVFPHVLKSCSDRSSIEETKCVHCQILKSGFDGYSVVQTALVDSYAKCLDLTIARNLFDEISDRNVVSWTAMISGYAKAGKIRHAVALFEEMPQRDSPSWNAIIAGCTQNGLFSEAILFFKRMIYMGDSNQKPNQVTLACTLSACGHHGILQIGKWIHGYIYKHDISQNSYIGNALVDMYGKCGSLKEASRVFEKMSERNVTSWNSMINNLALHGQSETAILVFREMERSDVKPDEVTFVGILNACTHGGLIDEGCNYFVSLKKDYGFEPQIQHYGCVIDLLGKAGQFDKAVELIRTMSMDPDEVIWGSLLNGCKIHGNMELAELAAQKLLEIEPENAGYGAMLANIYGECGKWDDVGKVRKMLKERGGHKIPGCSWIEIDGKAHRFYSADKSHPRTSEIYNLLEGMLLLSKTGSSLRNY